MIESDITPNFASSVLKRAEVAPVKAEPRIVTDVPGGPATGKKRSISGGGPGTACQYAALRTKGAVMIGSYARAAGCMSWIRSSVRLAGRPHPAQLPAPVARSRSKLTLKA